MWDDVENIYIEKNNANGRNNNNNNNKTKNRRENGKFARKMRTVWVSRRGFAYFPKWPSENLSLEWFRFFFYLYTNMYISLLSVV